jgi:hypothetical protein
LRSKAEEYHWDGSIFMNRIFVRDVELIRGNMYLEKGRSNGAIPDFETAGRCGAQLEAGAGLRKALYMREQTTPDFCKTGQ